MTLVASVFEFEPLSLKSLPPLPFQVGLFQMYASVLMLEGHSLHFKCMLAVGTIH